MPKGSGHAGSSKKHTVPKPGNQDDSNIVFGDSKSKKAKEHVSGRDPTSRPSETGSYKKVVNGDEVAKKPDTRQLIGGASWTGKLPVNLLSEHCQKLKWATPEYTMTKTPSGFISSVILKAVNPKTRELVVLPPFTLPPSYREIARPTAVEARHLAATYALFRVCNMRNIHMMLPPVFKDLWKKDFTESKNEDVKAGRGWMYEADPFVVKQEQDEARALREKQKIDADKQRSNEAKSPLRISLASGRIGRGPGRDVRKGWTNVPGLEMGKRTRAQVEDLIRRTIVWNPHDTQIAEPRRQDIMQEFINLGFRESHIREATDECKDREEALEWLLIHVPEDDLPSWSFPEGYVAGVSIASGDLKREAAVKRLSEVGYSTDLCSRILDQFQGDEGVAAEALQVQLVDASEFDIRVAQSDPTWNEELHTLSAIFADRFSQISSTTCEIQLQPLGSQASYTLRVRRSRSYPFACPIIAILSPELPAFIRLSIIRQGIENAKANLLGEAMIFNIVDWLENEIPKIVQNPGKLRNVSAGTSAIFDIPTGPKKPLVQRQQPCAVSRKPRSSENLALLDRWQAKQRLPQQQKMLAARQKLPAWEVREEIVNAVNSHQVTIITGETGSGKSTQSVQYILDDMIQRKVGATANIICTQPRRISALGLADRVSDERCSTVGEEIGYAIRGESRQKSGVTKITFVTTGVLLRRIQTSDGSQEASVAALADVSHVVVDEVHERTLDSDFLLILLKDILGKRSDFKVILMSATLDANVFETYFNGTSSVARIEIQGRMFPVEDYYLDDVLRITGFNESSNGNHKVEHEFDSARLPMANRVQSLGMSINYGLIARTVQAVDTQLGLQDGGILIFLPGVLEITRALDALKDMPNLHALPLHASLPPGDQRRVFQLAPKGRRKVIAATNVAETSITIEDIVAVIDTGRVKETCFDSQNNMVKLEEVWVSRAACKQRRGRAGRVQSGKCFKLYTQNAEAKMAERPEPEIRRVPLEQLCLSVRAMGVHDISNFLANALTPPQTTAVEGAVSLLGRMGAIDGNDLTALGRHLSMIPADLRCGKLMVYGATFGCLEACLTIAAILTTRSPFVSPQAKREESKAARALFAPNQGDLLCDLRAFEEWSKLKSTSSYRDVRRWCDEHYLSGQTLNDVSSNRSHYLASLQDTGFLPNHYNPTSHTSLNAHGSNSALIRALIAGAFNPQVARIEFPQKKFAPSVSGAVKLDPEARTIRYFNQENGRVFVHPSSTLFDAQGFVGNSVYLTYFNKMATSKVFIRDLTPFNAYSLLLFSGPITVDTLGRGLIVDGWLHLRGWARIGVLASRLRLLLDDVLAKKIESPGLDLGQSEVVGIVRKLVELDGLDR
ncbi:MAG: hypothetical protein LQ342_002996 [Letrouitia transgressa]|nr:MAG: hypothetical protein LQ342_002996 [Letrouitia transgressa]